MSEKLTLRYSREEMAFLRETTMSRTRPSNLSKDFDNENGLFSPDKWLEYRWRCEGVENRVGGRRKPTGSRTSEVAASEDASVLSPQRRGFASGCRASSPKPTEGEGQSKSGWRGGRAANGTDFKPAFQKSALESKSKDGGTGSSCWRGPNGEVMKSWTGKSGSRITTSSERERSFSHTDDKVPEWMDEGPVSTTDIIELKGFDDDVGGKKTKKKKTVQRETVRAQSSVSTEGTPRDKDQSGSNSLQGSRPPSSPMNPLDQARAPTGNGTVASAVPEGFVKSLPERTISPKGRALLEGLSTLPNSDAEFAKIMGLLDNVDPSVDSQTSAPASQQPSSSRFSRFFSRSAAASTADTNNNAGQPGPRPIVGQSKQVESPPANANALGPNLLQKLFATANAAKPSVSTNPTEATATRPVRLEDLEREIAAKHVPGGSQQSLFDDRSVHNPVLTASSQNAFANSQISEQQTLMNLLNSRQQLQRPSPPAQPSQVQQSRVSPVATSGAPGFPPNFPSPMANFARPPNAAPPPGMLPNPLMRPDVLLQARLQQNALLQNIHARLLQSSMTNPELFQNQAAMRAAFNQMVQNATLASAVNAAAGLPPNLPPMNLPPPNITAASTHTSEASTTATSAASGGKQIPNTSYMPTSVMRQMTKTPSRQQNSSGSQSASTTPVNLPSHLHNLSEALAGGLPGDRRSPTGHSSPTRLEGAGSPTAAPGNKANKPVPLSMTDVNPYSPQGYAAAAAMVGANPGITQIGPWRFPIPPLAMAQFNSDQQQLAMAVQRGDLAAAEVIRARIIAQVQAMASLPPYSPFIAPPGLGMPGMPPQGDQRDLPSPPSSACASSPMKLPDILAHTRMADAHAANTMPPTNALDHILSSHGASDAMLASLVQQPKPTGPAILNRLPPTAKPITVEDLERELAGMKAPSS